MMNRLLFVFLLVCASTYFVDAQLHYKGECPPINPMKNLNITGMFGTWYLQEKYYFYYGEGICQRNIIDGDGSDKFSYKTQVFDLEKKETVTDEIMFTFTNPNKEAVFKRVTPPGGGVRFILDTDYSSYYIYFGCRDFDKYHARIAHLYTREQYPEADVIEKLYSAMKAHNLDTDHLIPENQKCPV